MGLSYWPTKGSRRPGSSPKTRRNFSLKSYFGCNSDVRRRIDLLGLMCAVEVEIAFHSAARTGAQFEVFDAGISHLHTGTVLAVLKHRVVHIQLLFCVGHDVVCPNTEIIQFAEKLELPIVIRFIDQRWFRKDC